MLPALVPIAHLPAITHGQPPYPDTVHLSPKQPPVSMSPPSYIRCDGRHRSCRSRSRSTRPRTSGGRVVRESSPFAWTCHQRTLDNPSPPSIDRRPAHQLRYRGERLCLAKIHLHFVESTCDCLARARLLLVYNDVSILHESTFQLGVLSPRQHHFPREPQPRDHSGSTCANEYLATEDSANRRRNPGW